MGTKIVNQLFIETKDRLSHESSTQGSWFMSWRHGLLEENLIPSNPCIEASSP